MSARWLPRQHGLVLTCDGHGDEGGNCNERVQTAAIRADANRNYAKSVGWGRGLITGRRRRDLCPACLLIEQKEVAERKVRRAERLAKRDAKRKLEAVASTA